MQTLTNTAETSDQLVENFQLLKADNNLDRRENLEALPESPAVYGIFGRINGEPANCRFIGYTESLRSAIQKHYTDEKDACLRTFMQSIKLKTLTYQLVGKMPDTDRQKLEKEWKEKHKPECNETLNQVF